MKILDAFSRNTARNVSRSAGLALILAFAAAPGARADSDLPGQRLKSALNAMVRDVRQAETPAAKRALMEDFIARAERNAALLERIPFLSGENREALDQLQEKFSAYAAELHGGSGPGESSPGVADADLDAFASFMQQGLEQADSGGIYLSTGAVIIILLIILILL